jgi:tetratricopeptide (TPR) repeat protein
MREPGQLSGQIAHHYQLAGEDEPAARYHRLAGEQASRLFANEDALKHFQTALALGHPEAARLHESIGDLQTILGDYDAALRSYETCASLGQPADLSAIEHKLGRVHHRLGEWSSAESHFQAALEVSDSPRQRSLIYADRSLTAHNSGEPDKARPLGRKALNLAETIGDKRALAQAHNILGILARGRGDFSRAREHLQKSLDLAQELEDPWLRVAALNNLALLSNQDADLDAAISLLKTALSLCTSLGDRHRAAALHSNLADLYHVGGMPEESMSHLKQSVGIYAEIGEQAGAWQPEVWKLVEW